MKSGARRTKSRSKVSVFFILLLVIGEVFAFLVLTVSLFSVSRVLATVMWTDSFNVYTNVTVFQPSLRNFTNFFSIPVDVKMYIINTINAGKLDLYKTQGNSTLYVEIANGSITQPQNTYTDLAPNATLTFDVYAKPDITLATGEVITIQKRIEISQTIPPPPLHHRQSFQSPLLCSTFWLFIALTLFTCLSKHPSQPLYW